MPAISVLLPVYNGGAFFEKAVESILAQSFADFELLIGDDGSTDGSGDVARRLAGRDARIRLISRENRGLVATLNELADAAAGSLLARMDADDIALPTRFQTQVDFMQAHAECVCVGGGQILIDEADRKIAPVIAPPDDRRIQEIALQGSGSICHPTAMIRAEVLRAVGGYRRDFYPAEDLDLWLRLGEAGKLANVPEPVLLYRVHSNSISGQSAQGRQRDAVRRACEAAWARRGLAGIVLSDTSAWRPSDNVDSLLRYTVKCGWMAFGSGFRATASAYGRKAIRLAPTSVEAWKLWAVSTFKRGGGDARERADALAAK